MKHDTVVSLHIHLQRRGGGGKPEQLQSQDICSQTKKKKKITINSSQCCNDCDRQTGLMLNRDWHFSYDYNQTGSGPTQPPISCTVGTLSPGRISQSMTLITYLHPVKMYACSFLPTLPHTAMT